jgi:hypothetical protein
LVPGWTLDSECEPQRFTEPSLEIFSPNVCVKIDHSIIGRVQIDPAIEISLDDNIGSQKDSLSDNEALQARCQGIGQEVRLDPIRICINDSVLDATNSELEVLGAPGCPVAHACVNILRSTVFGQIHAHAIELGENSIFMGRIFVARRQQGCLRFCYITPESRTPRRYRCQPDLVDRLVEENLRKAATAGSSAPSEAQVESAKQCERVRVRPQFNSVRYGTPTYCQLNDGCAEEIKRGADDESEMGVFHDLFQLQRIANLRVRLEEYTPSATDADLVFAN